METAVINVTIYGAHYIRRDGLGKNFAFAAVASLDNQVGVPVLSEPHRYDWQIDHEAGPDRSKAIKIELPEGVAYGDYSIANVRHRGLYATAPGAHHWGNGRMVQAVTNTLTVHDTMDDNVRMIDEAILSGITLRVPQADGSLADVPARVLDVYPFGMSPDDRVKWEVMHRA